MLRSSHSECHFTHRVQMISIIKPDLEGPRRLRGRSGGGLRGVLGRPEGIRGRLGAVLEAILRQSDFRTFFVSMLGSSWAILEPSWAPQAGGKGAQVGAKTDPKSKTKTTMRQEGLQDRLGEVLEVAPSWPILRPSWGRLGRDFH